MQEDSSSDSKDEESKKEPVVPVMRRHGEPLMIMPEWESAGRSDRSRRQEETDSYDDPFDSEKRFFEHQTAPYQSYHDDPFREFEDDYQYNRRHLYQNSALVEEEVENITSGQEEDDLAHAVIDTFSQVMQPYPT